MEGISRTITATTYIWYLIQKYVQPWLYGITQPSKSPQETLMETCNAILTSVELLKKSMTSLESSLDRHSYKLDQVSQNMEVRLRILYM